MLSSTATALLSLILAATTGTNALSLPRATKNESNTHDHSLKNHTTGITYYQGELSSSDACGEGSIAVSHGNITTNVCHQAFTYAISVQALPHRDCKYTLYSNTANCTRSNTGSSDGDSDSDSPAFGSYPEGFTSTGDSNESRTPMPKGSGAVCVVTGVYDGGAHTYASGKWTCD